MCSIHVCLHACVCICTHMGRYTNTHIHIHIQALTRNVRSHSGTVRACARHTTQPATGKAACARFRPAADASCFGALQRAGVVNASRARMPHLACLRACVRSTFYRLVLSLLGTPIAYLQLLVNAHPHAPCFAIVRGAQHAPDCPAAHSRSMPRPFEVRTWHPTSVSGAAGCFRRLAAARAPARWHASCPPHLPPGQLRARGTFGTAARRPLVAPRAVKATSLNSPTHCTPRIE